MCRVDPEQEQRWTVYAFSVLAFSVVGLLLLYAMQRLQTVCRSIRHMRRVSVRRCPSTPRPAS